MNTTQQKTPYKKGELYPNRGIWVQIDGRNWEVATIGEIDGNLINFEELPFVYNFKTRTAYLWGKTVDQTSFRVGKPYTFNP